MCGDSILVTKSLAVANRFNRCRPARQAVFSVECLEMRNIRHRGALVNSQRLVAGWACVVQCGMLQIAACLQSSFASRDAASYHLLPLPAQIYEV